jgi:hypothetical protein
MVAVQTQLFRRVSISQDFALNTLSSRLSTFISYLTQNRTVITGLTMGIAFARIGYHYLPADWRWLVLILYSIGYFWGTSSPQPRWTFWGLLLYIATPVPMPRLAVFGIGLALVGASNQTQYTKITVGARHAVPPLLRYIHTWMLVGIMAFAVLLLTLSPGILAADAGELQVVAAKWGVAHPPGYPLYTIIAGTFSHTLPFQTPAWRVNLFSAFTGAATVALAAYIVQRETKNALSGWLAGLMLLTATTFWMTATQASVRPLTILFAGLMLEAALAYRQARQADQTGRGALVRFGVVAGLGVTHHGSIFFLGGVFALGIVAADRRNWRQWWIPIVAAFAGLIPIIYLPLRVNGLFAHDYLTTLDGLRYHVFAEGFAGDMFALANPRYWPERWQVMVEVFRLQWTGGTIIFALVGWLFLVYRDRWLGAMLGGAFLAHSFVAGTYRAPQIVEYTLPAYLIVAVVLGWAVGKLRHPHRIVAGALVLFIGIGGFQNNWITMRRLAATEEARVAAEATLAATPQNTNILSSWHRYMPLLYLQEVEGKRPDAITYYVTFAGAPTPMEEWAIAMSNHIEAAGQVMVTQLYPETYRFLPFTFEGQRVSRMPSITPTSTGGISFGSNTLLDSTFATESRAGERLPVSTTWDLPDAMPFGSFTTFIHLGAVEAPPLTQIDRPSQTTAPGAVESFYDLLIPATTPPGQWSLMTGAYTPGGALLTDNGQVRVTLGTVRVHPAQFPLPTQHPVSIPMNDARLLGWDIDSTLPHAPVLYLHWRLDEANRQYLVTVTDDATTTLSTATADVADQTGYWTSVHPLPPDATSLRVKIDETEFRLPSMPDDEHYILFGNIGVLVDWELSHSEDEVRISTAWLAAGATFAEVGINLNTPHLRSSQAGSTSPITNAIPTTKWSYGHIVHSEQVLILEPGAPFEGARLSLYDVYTGQSLFIADTRLTADAPGLYLGP